MSHIKEIDQLTDRVITIAASLIHHPQYTKDNKIDYINVYNSALSAALAIEGLVGEWITKDPHDEI